MRSRMLVVFLIVVGLWSLNAPAFAGGPASGTGTNPNEYDNAVPPTPPTVTPPSVRPPTVIVAPPAVPTPTPPTVIVTPPAVPTPTPPTLIVTPPALPVPPPRRWDRLPPVSIGVRG
jgi:hypothetical protein